MIKKFWNFIKKKPEPVIERPKLSGNVDVDLVVDAVERVLGPVAQQHKNETKFQKLKFFTIAAFVASLILMNVFGDHATKLIRYNNDYVSLVRISGPIMPMSLTSPEMINPLLEKAFKDEKAKGIIININSPGGTPVASNEIRERIIDLRKEYPDREVIVVGGDMLTSGAYMIASGSPTIYANDSSIVGSIGVIIRTFGFQDVMEKIGVERRVLAAGTNKNGLDQYSAMSPEVKSDNEARLGLIHTHFKDMVAESRGDRISLEENPELFSGKTWAGSVGAENGLLDGTMTLAQASEKHFGTTNFNVYEPRQAVFGRGLGGGFANAILQAFGIETPVTASPSYNGPQVLLMPQ